MIESSRHVLSAGAVERTPQQQFISPATRHNVGLTSPAPAVPAVATNDDKAEKRDRRRSRVLELQRKNLSSPVTPSAERRRSLPLGGYSNAQLTEHYANCIKLSTENKINAKNAFGLHLIDYMADLLRKKEMTSFQVASSTLDASAKIYAGRVDAIHSETFKVLSGLGRRAKEDGDGDAENDDAPAAEHEKKRKRVRRSHTIETNLKNLDVNKFDLGFEVDPLFQKTSAAFDEGGTGGLLLNHLRCLDDGSELILDSNTIAMDTSEPTPSQSDRASKPVDITEFKDLCSKLSPLDICPAFSNFEFTNWNSNADDTQSNSTDDNLGKGDHAFDLDAEVEPITGPDDAGDNVYDDGFEHDDVDDADMPAAEERTTIFGEGGEAKLVESAVHDIRHGGVDNLVQILATEPSDYSYFESNLLSTWAGPAHWKLKAKSKEQSTIDKEEKKKNRLKKEKFKIKFDFKMDFKEKFKETKAATTLTKATLEKYSKTPAILPVDLHYNGDDLRLLFEKPVVLLKRLKWPPQDVEDGVETYDYENAKDVDNFCPADMGDGHDDDDDDDGIGFDFTAASHDLSTQAQQDMGNEELSGSNLVAQPRKVEVLDIAYAKTAKKVDVKRLKASMWNIMSRPEEDKVRPVDPQENREVKEDGKQVVGNHSFQSLVQELPQKLSKNMSKNLSVPIAFVCLLHLANEKTLKITSSDTMTDLQISQG